MKLSAVDLFCGTGGLSAGLMDAGLDVAAAYDHWEAAVRTYRRNLGEHVFQRDIADIDALAEDISNHAPDLIAGGPPCQDYSSAGKCREGERANLTMAFGEIVARCQPAFFIMENVPLVRLSDSYRKMKAALERAGYRVAEVVLDASQCGVPQARKRFFAFGSTSGGVPERFLDSIGDRLATEKMTVKEYLGREIDIQHYYRHPRNYARRSVFSVDEPSPTVRGVNRPVPPNYKGNHLDSVPPSTVRPLTSRERSRIQTFPATWQWEGSDRNAEVELQIGNAVPVNLAAFVAKGALDAARGRASKVMPRASMAFPRETPVGTERAFSYSRTSMPRAAMYSFAWGMVNSP